MSQEAAPHNQQQPEPPLTSGGTKSRSVSPSLSVSVVTQPPPHSCCPFTAASCSNSGANNSHSLTLFSNFEPAVWVEGPGEQKSRPEHVRTTSLRDSQKTSTRGTSFLGAVQTSERSSKTSYFQTSRRCPRAARRKVLLNIFSVRCADMNFRLDTSLYIFSEHQILISFETLQSQFSHVLQ